MAARKTPMQDLPGRRRARQGRRALTDRAAARKGVTEDRLTEDRLECSAAGEGDPFDAVVLWDEYASAPPAEDAPAAPLGEEQLKELN